MRGICIARFILIFLFACITVTAVIYLSGCGGGDKTVTVTTPADQSATTTGEIKPSEQVGDCPQNSGKLLFSSELNPQGPFNFDIYVANEDGSGITRLTEEPNWQGGPAWSPEHCRIAYAFSTDSKSKEDIYVMNADGSGSTRLTQETVEEREPDWSPDGSRIVYMSERDGNRNIYVMNSDGSDPRRLTDNPVQDEDPEWSPTADEIIFSSHRDGNWEVYRMKSDGSGQTRLTDEKMGDNHPAWSPDGKQIAFISNRSHYVEIYIMNRDGTGLRQVTSQGGGTPSVDIELTWSPDGKWLAFTSTVAGQSGGGMQVICAVQPDGSDLHVLVNRDPSRSHEPAW